MLKVNPYKLAWKSLVKEIETKTGWGKNELKELMDKLLIDAFETVEETEWKTNITK